MEHPFDLSMRCRWPNEPGPDRSTAIGRHGDSLAGRSAARIVKVLDFWLVGRAGGLRNACNLAGRHAATPQASPWRAA
jgi:hypothetical protein